MCNYIHYLSLLLISYIVECKAKEVVNSSNQKDSLVQFGAMLGHQHSAGNQQNLVPSTATLTLAAESQINNNIPQQFVQQLAQQQLAQQQQLTQHQQLAQQQLSSQIMQLVNLSPQQFAVQITPSALGSSITYPNPGSGSPPFAPSAWIHHQYPSMDMQLRSPSPPLPIYLVSGINWVQENLDILSPPPHHNSVQSCSSQYSPHQASGRLRQASNNASGTSTTSPHVPNTHIGFRIAPLPVILTPAHCDHHIVNTGNGYTNSRVSGEQSNSGRRGNGRYDPIHSTISNGQLEESNSSWWEHSNDGSN